MDDNDFNLFALQNVLEQFKIKADEARSGVEAIKKASCAEYDLIFMDCLMPVMDGFEVNMSIIHLIQLKGLFENKNHDE